MIGREDIITSKSLLKRKMEICEIKVLCRFTLSNCHRIRLKQYRILLYKKKTTTKNNRSWHRKKKLNKKNKNE